MRFSDPARIFSLIENLGCAKIVDGERFLGR
jgi:hypothetical protein